MTKKLLFLVAIAGLIFANNGCTSKKAEDDQQAVENADIEKIEADGMGTTAQAPDASLDSALGEAPATTTPSDSAAPTMDDSSLSLDTADAPATSTPEALPAIDIAPPMITETPIVPSDSPTTLDNAALAESLGPNTPDIPMQDTSPTSSFESATPFGSTASEVTTTKPVGSSIKKVSATTPYQAKNGGWVNTVYIARPKEKLSDISMKIFGADKIQELKKIAENNYLKSRSVKAGDKIYYVSPNRPDDSSKTMLYYEDMGMVPEIYVAKKGESLKKVSKTLLGYDNAWREVWSSNGMESKNSLKDGETIRYWAATESAFTAAPAAGGAKLMDSSQAPQATSTIEPPSSLPPPPTDANANLPPPPDQATLTPPLDASAGLPPPPADLAPPPPPPPPDVVATADGQPKNKINLDEAAAAEASTGELDSDTMMSMGALGVLVAMMAFVIIRKKKQKAQMMSGEMNA